MRAAAQPPRPDVRHCVALFVDLHAFTAFTGETDPEEVHDYLLRYRARSAELVREGGGEITNYIGARVMAVFGAMVAHDNEAAACRGRRAGLARGDSRPCLQQRPLVPAAHRRGERRAVRRSLLGRPVVSGEPVSLAARIMEQAGPGEILVSGWVRHALSDGVHADPISDCRCAPRRGRCSCGGCAAGPIAAETARALVGRALELRQIEGLLDACQTARTGHVLLVRGEAGIGKSRLVQELLQRARTRGYACHRALVLDFGERHGGRGDPGAGARAPGRVRRRDPQRVRERVQRDREGSWSATSRPSSTSCSSCRSRHELSDASGPRCDGEGACARPPGRTRQSHPHTQPSSPLLLVVEDVHWADRATLETAGAGWPPRRAICRWCWR